MILWMNEWVFVCCVLSIECMYIQVYRGCHCWHRVSAVHFPYIKPCNQYVLLAPCTVVLCLVQTLVHFSSFGFLTYISFCLIILRFPSFIDLVQIVACWHDMIYDMSLFVRNHILFKSVSLRLCLHTFRKSLNVNLVHLQCHITLHHSLLRMCFV
jgi:hypothetical protein